jgi:hypothetical protein
MDEEAAKSAISKRELQSMQRTLRMLHPYPPLVAIAKDNGGDVGEIRYSPLAGASPYVAMHLGLHLQWMQEHIQSFALSFGGTAGALAFLKKAKPWLKGWIGRTSARQVTIRAGGISVEIKGESNIQDALNAFREVSDALNKKKEARAAPAEINERATLTKRKAKSATKKTLTKRKAKKRYEERG